MAAMARYHQGQELNALNSAIDSATVDFSQGAFQLVVSETERAAKDEQDRAEHRSMGIFTKKHRDFSREIIEKYRYIYLGYDARWT